MNQKLLFYYSYNKLPILCKAFVISKHLKSKVNDQTIANVSRIKKLLSKKIILKTFILLEILSAYNNLEMKTISKTLTLSSKDVRENFISVLHR